jgi:hypothetical protein
VTGTGEKGSDESGHLSADAERREIHNRNAAAGVFVEVQKNAKNAKNAESVKNLVRTHTNTPLTELKGSHAVTVAFCPFGKNPSLT